MQAEIQVSCPPYWPSRHMVFVIFFKTTMNFLELMFNLFGDWVFRFYVLPSQLTSFLNLYARILVDLLPTSQYLCFKKGFFFLNVCLINFFNLIFNFPNFRANVQLGIFFMFFSKFPNSFSSLSNFFYLSLFCSANFTIIYPLKTALLASHTIRGETSPLSFSDMYNLISS